MDEYNAEWLMWRDIRAVRPLDWTAMLALRRKLRQVFDDSHYTRTHARAFFVALRREGSWARDVVEHCGKPRNERMRKVWHGARGYTVVDGWTPYQAMEKAA